MQNTLYILIFIVICSCTKTSKNHSVQNGQNNLDTIAISPIDTLVENNSEMELADTIKKHDIVNLDVKENENVENIIKPIEAKPAPLNKKIGSLYIETPIFDFGRVTEGTVIEHDFVVENTGNADLHITDIEVDCGCTVPKYSKDAIAPNTQSTISIVFDTKGKLATQVRYITIYTDGKPLSKLVRLKGIVTTD